MDAIPGTYVLIMKSHSSAHVRVGRWGCLSLQPDYYVYVGSAFGPGGVRARVQRHWRESKSIHWHIDYLRTHVTPVSAWYYYGTRDIEHKWADLFSGLDSVVAIEGFGCSDCQCLSHLFRTVSKPNLTQFCTMLGQDIHATSYVADC